MDIWSNPHLPVRNMDRWVKGMRDIYASIRKGTDAKEAFLQTTSTWDDMEKLQFKDWMKFYQGNGQDKYIAAGISNDGLKAITAQHQLQSTLPQPRRYEEPSLPNAMEERIEKEQRLKDWKGALLSRLYAAEKILGKNPDLQLELQQQGLDVRKLLSTLHWLTEEIQTARLRRSSALLTAMVIKNANRLLFDGNVLEARALVRIALTDEASLDRQDLINSSKILMEGMEMAGKALRTHQKDMGEELMVLAQMVQNEMGVTSPTNPQGIAPMNPADTVSALQPLAPSGDSPSPNFGKVEVPEGDEDSIAMKEFLKNLSGEDSAKVDDEDDDGDDVNKAAKTLYHFEVLAQAAPPQATLPPPPQELQPATDPLPDIEVSDLPEQHLIAPDSVINIDDNFNKALQNVKVPDIIMRLEGVAKLFKNREISRQLSIIDLMMDSVGIAPFFPSMAETMQKSLEANQYCQTRVEDILAKLRGTVTTPISRSVQDQVIEDPTESAVKEKLQQQELAEQAKKEKKRQADLEEAAPAAPLPQPIGEKAQQELAGPAELPPPAPPPPRPQ